MPAALDLLRSHARAAGDPRTRRARRDRSGQSVRHDRAWPELRRRARPHGPTRIVGRVVILVDGAAAAYLRRGERELLLFAPAAEPRRSQVAREVARALRERASGREPGQRGMLVAQINGQPASDYELARVFVEEGFAASAMGLQMRRVPATMPRIRDGGIAEGRTQEPMDETDDTPTPRDLT